MDHDTLLAVAKKIWDAHRAAGRDSENPPHRLARAESGGHWAEVWVTGLDTASWFYRLSDRESDPVLIAINLNTEGAEGVQSAEVLLQTHGGQRRLSGQEWQEYLKAWLGTANSSTR